MKKFHSNSMKALAFSASAIAFVVAGPVNAQDTGEEGQEAAEEEEEQVQVSTDASGQATQGQGGITVTGSRIVRDTYSSISPLQVLSTENQQAVGAFDPAQILQRSEAAAGQQIDATFQGFVLDNGPGSQTINLRGLGADRTLVLVNGRRLAPAGVEGAPTNPSINLIPASLVDRYDLLTDGASSVYGSDAVAGVVNVILRKDFDGLELQANGDINPQGGGDDYTVSAAWGFTTDRAVFGIGAEYQRRDLVRLRDRDFLAGCDTHYEVDQNGNILTLGVRDNAIVQNRNPGISVSDSECKQGGISGRIFNAFTRFGSIYFPGNGNIANIPGLNFGDSSDAFGNNLDIDGNGIRDVDFQNVNTNGSDAEINRTFISEQDLINVFTYGEYTFPGEANITPFFEAQYTRAEVNNPSAGNPQIFPSVPDFNMFNPCNISSDADGVRLNPNGVDCRAADNNLQQINPGQPNFGRAGRLSTGISTPVTPIASINGDRNNFEVVQEQYRGVLGVRGDLPFVGSSWTFEVAGVYSRSEGRSSRIGIREDRLAFALGLDPTQSYGDDGVIDNDGDGIADDYDNDVDVFATFGDPQFIGECNVAGLANPNLAAPDLVAGCVPVNLFSASVLTGAVGDLETQAERDYIFGTRTFDTTYEQILLSGYVTGDLFELPAGPVGVVLGVEWRDDKIDSQPDFVASNGLLFGFFSDKGAVGSKWTRELFGELDIPLMAGETLVEELTVNVSGRITEDEVYGTNGTFSLKGGWRPVPPLLFKFSYGTSFRAPNLRENFLLGQSGFLNLFDPCAVPDDAFTPAGGYNAAEDDRDQNILDACVREGRDPTVVGIAANGLSTEQVSSVEISTMGSLDIDPETSRSITTGFAFEESFPSGFDFAFNFNYYDLKVKDSIVELSSQFAINDCFTRDDGLRSSFCDLLEYGVAPSTAGRVVQANPIFLNQDQESVRGIDINTTFGYPVTIGSEVFDVQLNFVANHLIERSDLFIDDAGNPIFDDDAGEFGFPDWTGRVTLNVDWKDFRFTWQTRYISDVEQQADGIDPLSSAFGRGPDGTATGFNGDTCLGDGTANVPGDGVFCRDVGFADEYFESSASVRWDNGDFRIIAGVRNLFDENPPLVDSNEVLAISNTPIGNGYNLDGREFFGQLLYRF